LSIDLLRQKFALNVCKEKKQESFTKQFKSKQIFQATPNTNDKILKIEIDSIISTDKDRMCHHLTNLAILKSKANKLEAIQDKIVIENMKIL